MKWYEYYEVWLGLSMHFQSNYDYTVSGPKKCSNYPNNAKSSLVRMEGYGDSKEDFEDRVISVLRYEPKFVVAMYSPPVTKLCKDYRDEVRNSDYNLRIDLTTVFDVAKEQGLSIKEIFRSSSNLRLPLIAELMVKNKIKMHSFCALNAVIDFEKHINKMIWNPRIQKYAALHTWDKKEIGNVLKPFIESYGK